MNERSAENVRVFFGVQRTSDGAPLGPFEGGSDGTALGATVARKRRRSRCGGRERRSRSWWVSVLDVQPTWLCLHLAVHRRSTAQSVSLSCSAIHQLPLRALENMCVQQPPPSHQLRLRDPLPRPPIPSRRPTRTLPLGCCARRRRRYVSLFHLNHIRAPP